MADYGTQYGPRDYGWEFKSRVFPYYDLAIVSQSYASRVRYNKKEDWFEVRGKYHYRAIHGCPYNNSYINNFDNFQTGSVRAVAFLERFDSIDYKESLYGYGFDDPNNQYIKIFEDHAEWSDVWPTSTNIYLTAPRPSGKNSTEFDYTPTSSVWGPISPIQSGIPFLTAPYTPNDTYPYDSTEFWSGSYSQVTYNGARGLGQYTKAWASASALLTDSYFSSSTNAVMDALPWISNTYGITSRFRYDEFGHGREQTIVETILDNVKLYAEAFPSPNWHTFDPDLIVNITGSARVPDGITNAINPFRSYHNIYWNPPNIYGITAPPQFINSYGSQCKFFGPYVIVDYYYCMGVQSPHLASVAVIREEGFLSGRPNDVTSPYIHIGFPDMDLVFTNQTHGTGLKGNSLNYEGQTLNTSSIVFINSAERRVYRNETAETIQYKLDLNPLLNSGL